MTPEELLAPYPPDRRDAVEALRALVRRAVPDAIEAVRPGWRLIGYDVPVGRRTRYFAFVWPEVEHVHLGFEHGIFLRDPDRILQGAHLRLRKVRFVTIGALDEIRPELLEPIVQEAASVARMDRLERLSLLLDRP